MPQIYPFTSIPENNAGLSITSTVRVFNPSGTFITLSNQTLSDSVYEAVTDSNGLAIIPRIWAGTYFIQIQRFLYLSWSTVSNLHSNVALMANLEHRIMPPSGVETNELSLQVTWKVPPEGLSGAFRRMKKLPSGSRSDIFQRVFISSGSLQ